MPRGRPRKTIKAPRHQIGSPLAGMTVDEERIYAETIRTRYWELGMTQPEIAAEDGRSVFTIYAIMRRHQIPVRHGAPARLVPAAQRGADPLDELIGPALSELGR